MSHTPTEYNTLTGRMLIAFRESFSEGLQVDADQVLRFVMRDLCSHLAAEVIALDQLNKGATIEQVVRMLTDGAEGR